MSNTSLVNVVAKKGHVVGISKNATALSALCELIWNGFDAQANTVEIELKNNVLGHIENIIVSDDGIGIPHEDVNEAFGNLGESKKLANGLIKGRPPIHGKHARGRFKAFKLGSCVSWETTYSTKGEKFRYKIEGSSNSIMSFQVSSPEKTTNKTGTIVEITNLNNSAYQLRKEQYRDQLTATFACFLTSFPQLSIIFDGLVINPNELQIDTFSKKTFIEIDTDKKIDLEVKIILWSKQWESSIHLCNTGGISYKENKSTGIKSYGYPFSSYITSDYIDFLNAENRLDLEELDEICLALKKEGYRIIQDYFDELHKKKQKAIIIKWQQQNIYPYKEIDSTNLALKAEIELFNELAYAMLSKLADFDSRDVKSKAFTLSLLSQTLKNNPESLQEIFSQVLGLKKSESEAFSDLLTETKLPSIIQTASLITHRCKVLEGLKHLIYSCTKTFKEKQHLHKILEKESWIFDERFSLADSEIGLKRVLTKHIHKLDKKQKKQPDILNGRLDILLHKSLMNGSEKEFLVVELKRPSVKIDDGVALQIKQYAQAIHDDDEYRRIPCRWKFIAVSSKIDSIVENDINQPNKPQGLLTTFGNNMEVLIKTWDEVFYEAESNLLFLKEQLNYSVSEEAAKAHMIKEFPNNIPTTI